jgi:hypothetical protein
VKIQSLVQIRSLQTNSLPQGTEDRGAIQALKPNVHIRCIRSNTVAVALTELSVALSFAQLAQEKV